MSTAFSWPRRRGRHPTGAKAEITWLIRGTTSDSGQLKREQIVQKEK